ncbi:MAG: TIGR03617 family F420-dependent LLM class oxidoreductase [Blastocatellia bacterium]|nr:TIGR03617 family F420-dependent LLM class oxidoreductase [Blastocatellia bacterium]MCS7157901.1 TIGR03617 family F420-dependent LLM class oxidoreductase [Blastocatellia bacterium]MDW8168021.1 TIGR03617 family F420-dependent LLM class oxidoreductase [Acidobacteriota bacterium]MDW8255761.1 TIGR03617 family F420-dependent LLM class oxidoreductase [Acidobacteriota bacterium]
MKVDLILPRFRLEDVPALARRVEALGFDGLWFGETGGDPFLAIALAAEHTTRITLGTGIAVAFPRSPMITAYIAWDLQRLSRGRMILGLGSQVKGHIERRFGLKWKAPAPWLREYIAALRAIWAAWRDGAPLNFRGEQYTLSLMTPFFTPEPNPYADIPVHISAVNRRMLRLAGEVADGVHVHPLHSERYVREIALPELEAGWRAAGRERSQFEIVAAAIIVSGRDSTEWDESQRFARAQIGFYGSTPTYRLLLELHGFTEQAERLRTLAAVGRWDELADVVSEEMLQTFAIVAPPEEMAERLRERYRSLVDRIVFYGLRPPRPLEDEAFWRKTIQVLKA